MISFLKLIRYKNLLMVLLTMVLTKYALIDSFVYRSNLSNFQFVILAISVLCITAGGYIINDIFDIEADKVNKPNKVFVSKTISKKNAWRSYFLLNFLGLIFSFYFEDLLLTSIYFLIILSLFIYSYILKKWVLIGNFLISFLVVIPIYILFLIFISKNTLTVIKNNLPISDIILLYLLFAFLTTLIREIIKDIEDINGDLKINAKTLPIVIGRKRANNVALGFSIILMLFIIIIIREYLIDFPIFLVYSVLFILIPIGYFIYKLYSAESKKDYSYLSKLMKVIMFFGILSMLLFKLI